MTSEHPDADLFRPSLDASHDVELVDRPWDPASITMASFFVGPFGAAWLVARNQGRLRTGGLRWLLPVAGILVSVGTHLSIYFGPADAEPLESGQVRVLMRIATVALTWLALAPQRTRFRIFEHEGGKAAGMWGPGFLALFLNLLLAIVVAAVLEVAAPIR